MATAIGEKIIGIDLGTTNSCVAVLENGQPVIIPNREGDRTTPSVVGFRETDRLVGQLAKRQAIPNAAQTVFSIKRFMGRRWDETTQERNQVPFTCVPGAADRVTIAIRDRLYTPEEISACILQKLKQDAETYLGEPITKAVITVPAYFSEAQRQATKDAGTIAGLEVQRIINEPTAAALAYGSTRPDQEQRILVFDLGGGTFDVSVLHFSDRTLEVLATAGDNHLGGDDFDRLIMDELLQFFQTQEGVDLSQDAMALQRVREAAEKAKVELSCLPSTTLNLPFITADARGPKHLEMELTRTRFETLAQPLIERTLAPVGQALQDAGLTVDQLDRILLVGGSTRIPAVQAALRHYCRGKGLDSSMNPDEVVALGAAVQGGILARELPASEGGLIVVDVVPLTLSLETLGGLCSPMISRNTPVPASDKRLFSTAMDGQTAVEAHVVQGESPLVHKNISLGQLVLAPLPPAPRGVLQIEVTFDVDVDSTLTVSARELTTGQHTTAQFLQTSRLSQTDMQAILHRWELERDADDQQRQLIEQKNQADLMLQDYNALVQRCGTTLPGGLKQQAEAEAIALRQAIANPTLSLEDFQLCFQTFQQTLLALGRSLYLSSPAPSPRVPPAPVDGVEEDETWVAPAELEAQPVD